MPCEEVRPTVRVLVETVGSAGDVHPFVAVGCVLARRGHHVTLFANDHFRTTIERAGLHFRATGTQAEYDAITGDPHLWHPTRGPAVVLGNTVEHLLAPTVSALLAEGPGPGTVVVAPTLGFAGRCAAEIAGVPLVRVHLQPAVIRSVHRPPRLPGLWMPPGTPVWWKRLLYRLSDVAIDRIVCPRLDAFRAAHGLPRARRVFGDWIQEADRVLALYPEWFAPPQPDAPTGVEHTGFVLFDRGDHERPDERLAAWLRHGEPPVVFTHGSANVHGRAFFEASSAAARAVGRRALLVTTEPRAVTGLTDDAVRHVAYVPFGAVLPHAALFVHHGGIGTTARGFAAGLPQLVVPMGFDQPDNAARVEALGAGAALMARRYDARSATEALRRMAADAALRATALHIARRVDGDAAALRAAREIEEAGAAGPTGRLSPARE